MSTTRTAVVIPARMKATRLPDKPLLAIGGVPLVVRVARQALKAKLINEVIIATDAPEIADAARQYDISATMTRADHSSGTDRVAEVALALSCDAIINVQGDEPFISPADIDALAGALSVPGTTPDMVTLQVPITSQTEFNDPNVVKVVSDDRGRALYFSRAAIPHCRDSQLNLHPDPAHEKGGAWRHIGVYGYRREALRRLVGAPVHPLEEIEQLEQLRALALGMHITLLPAATNGVGIDTPEDLEDARQRFAEYGEAAFPD